MKIPTIKIAILILFLAAFPSFAKAKELWLKNIPVKQLQNLYQQADYIGERGYLMLPSNQYPKIFLKNFPENYTSITDEKERNALFIKIMAPLALKLNEELSAERQIITEIQSRFTKNNKLSQKDIDTIEKKSKKYDIFTRLKGVSRHRLLLKELSDRIDRIPPSIIITAAAIETNWGASRIVKEGNSLYKMLQWHTDKGLKPIGENTDNSYRIKTYPDIYASIKDYALKINSHPSFAMLRSIRSELRALNNLQSGSLLAPYVYGSSNLDNYAGLFDYTLAYYELSNIDNATLIDSELTATIQKKFSSYISKM